MRLILERLGVAAAILFFTILFDACIVTQAPIVTGTPTPAATAAPTQTPKAKPTKTPLPFGITMPESVSQGEKFRVTFNADEDTWVALWADKKYPLGDMRWDADNKIKYLDVTLDTRGTRQIWFRVNDLYVYFQNIEVTK